MFIGTAPVAEDKDIIKTVEDFRKLLEKALDVGTMIGYKGCSGDSISDIRLMDDTAYVVYEVVARQEVWA